MSAIRTGALTGLRYLIAVFFVGVLVQFFLAGYGIFAMHLGSTIDNAHSLNAHRKFGWALSEVGALMILVLVLVSRPSRKALISYLVLVVMTFAAPLLAKEGVHHAIVGMFHPVVATIVLGLSGLLAHRAWAPDRSATVEVEPTS